MADEQHHFAENNHFYIVLDMYLQMDKQVVIVLVLNLVTATEFEREIGVLDAKFRTNNISQRFIYIYIIHFSVCGRTTGNDSLFDLIIANCSSSFLESIEKRFLEDLIKI